MEDVEPNGVVAVFRDHDAAHRALEALSAAGVNMKEVSILGRGEPESVEGLPSELDHSEQTRGRVAAFWATWGATLGVGVAAGAVGIPLLGLLVGAGEIATLLAIAAGALGIGGGVGALTGALIGLGMHESHARAYEEALHAGKYLVVVHTDDPVQLRDSTDTLRSMGPESIEAHGLDRSSQVIARV